MTEEILEDGCYPEHNPEMSWCIHFDSGKQRYPRFPDLDDLLTIDEMAERLGVKRRHLAEARYTDPALPFLRFGAKLLVSKVQVAWWLNEIQHSTPDNYWLDRRRRLANGTGPLFTRKGANATSMVEETTDTDD